MHWTSLISFLVIVAICQAQTGDNKGSFQVVSGGNVAPGSRINPDRSVPANTGNVQSGSFVKHDHDGHNNKQVGNNRMDTKFNSGNHNQCSIILPFVLAVFISMMYF